MLKTIYLAGPFQHRFSIRLLVLALRAAGWVVMSSWLWEDESITGTEEEHLRDRAIIDTIELEASEVVVRFPSLGRAQHGGRFAEVGMAIALNKKVAIIGGWENVFDHLPQVKHLKDEGELLEWLQTVTGSGSEPLSN